MNGREACRRLKSRSRSCLPRKIAESAATRPVPGVKTGSRARVTKTMVVARRHWLSRQLKVWHSVIMDAEPTELRLTVGMSLAEFLADNGTDIGELLRAEGIEVELRKATANPESVGSKEPALVILASAALVLAVGQALPRVLGTIFNRRRIVKTSDLTPVVDSTGAPVRDSEGNPLLQVRETFSAIDSPEPRSTDELQASSPLLSFTYRTSANADVHVANKGELING
jgi:hypothetical protein